MKKIETAKLQAWMESYLQQYLSRNETSRYAKGRLQCWMKVEPSLTSPTRLSDGVPLPGKIWQRLQDVLGWTFDYCLVTYSGDKEAVGITPHRDASFANYEAWAINVSGECSFRYWEGRKSFGPSPNVTEYDPKKDEPTHTTVLSPGDVIRFNCKNLHDATPSVKRWNLNFWRKK